MTWRKSHTRRKRLRKHGINIKCGDRVFNLCLGGEPWKFTPDEIKAMNPTVHKHIEDYILR